MKKLLKYLLILTIISLISAIVDTFLTRHYIAPKYQSTPFMGALVIDSIIMFVTYNIYFLFFNIGLKNRYRNRFSFYRGLFCFLVPLFLWTIIAIPLSGFNTSSLIVILASNCLWSYFIPYLDDFFAYRS